MYKFEIREQGMKIATVKARNAEQALDIAERTIERRSCDYNIPDGETSEVEWFACAAEDKAANDDNALRMVSIPSETEAPCSHWDIGAPHHRQTR